MDSMTSSHPSMVSLISEMASSRYREMNSFSAGKLWLIPFYDIFSNVFLNFIAVVGIVAQCIKYLGKGNMRKVFKNFFRRRGWALPAEYYNNVLYLSCLDIDNYIG